MKTTRRSFIKTVAAGSIIAGMGGNVYAQSKKPRKILVLGGGYGGSSAAKYLKILDPSLEVTMVDRNASHVSCALSNEIVFGIRDISYITMPHKTIVDKYGVKFVQAEVTSLDAKKKTVSTSAGNLTYDKLIVSPGIGMDYDVENGFDSEMQKNYPHAWIAGPQTIQLRDMLKKVKKGSTLLLRTPKVIYRCPPGPYERSSLLGDFAKRNGCKVTILDANPKIASKAPLFQAAFEELYKDVLTYVPGAMVKSFDKGKKAVVTDKGSFTADFINFIPDQRAGDMAFTLGLVPEGKKWAPVKPTSFESGIFQDVYVIGDAIDPSVTDTPKSGVVANGTAKFVAENIVREFAGLQPLMPVIGNSCYSLVSRTEGIYIATVYHYDPKLNKIVVRNNANGIPPTRSEENYRNLNSWGQNMFSDVFA